MKNGRTFRQFLALLLCFAMILPNFTGLVSAAEDSSVSTLSTETTSTVEFDKTKLNAAPLKYTDGTVSEWLETDCGNGIMTSGENKSYLQVAVGTTYNAFNTYCKALVTAGYTAVGTGTNGITGSSSEAIAYGRYKAADGSHTVYVYILNNMKDANGAEAREVRVIVDTQADMVGDFANGFTYTSTTGQSGKQVAMVMYGLSMSQNGFDYSTTYVGYNTTGTRNCGALIVIRMPDNSLFINDGGDIQQWSDEACANFMQFCRELTGKTEKNTDGTYKEVVTINTWFVSHAHSDHYEGFPRFIARHHGEIDIKNVMYNIDSERKGSTRDMTETMQMVRTFFPQVKYYKPHTGESFNIAGIKFDVLWTQEDRFYPTSNGQELVIDTSDKGGTYREDCFQYTEYGEWYKSGKYPYSEKGEETKTTSDFNDTTTVLKVTFPTDVTGESKDVTSILYGDVNRVDQTIMDIYGYDKSVYQDTVPTKADYTTYTDSATAAGAGAGTGVLATDIMMLPHHTHDPHQGLVNISGATIFLNTQAKGAIYGLNDVVDHSVENGAVYRGKLVRYYTWMMQTVTDDSYELSSDRKMYWQGTETAAILFGGDTFEDDTPTGLARDESDPGDFVVYTMDAPYFPYTGWTVTDSVEVKATTGAASSTQSAKVTNTVFSLTQVNSNSLTEKNVYAIVHNIANKMLMYTAPSNTIEQDNITELGNLAFGSMDVVAMADAKDGQAYTNDSGTLYFAHEDRDAALWMLNTMWSKNPDYASYKLNTSTAILGGSTRYGRALFEKGYLGTDQGKWWYSLGYDADDVGTGAHATNKLWSGNMEYHTLLPSNSYLIFQDSTKSYNIYVEFFQGNTCVIYYSNTANTSIRFLTVDANGNWVQKEHTSVANAIADIENLKLRLYSYDPGSTQLTVQMSGPTEYTVRKGTTDGISEMMLAYGVAENLTVVETTGSVDSTIPFSGIVPEVGYYWIDASEVDRSNCGDYTAYVKYRNDDGTDTTIGEVTIHIVDTLVLDHSYTGSTTVYASQNSGLLGNVYADENGEEDCTFTANVNSAHEMYEEGKTISVNVGMLTRADGTTVDTSVAGTYTGLTLTYYGEVVKENMTLIVQQIDADNYPAYPEEGSVKVDKNGKAQGVNFNNSGVAKIELSATGIPMNKGVDLIIVVDLSASMKYGTDTTDDATSPDRRIDHMLTSLNSVVADLQASNADVRIAMSDFGDLDEYNFTDTVLDSSVYHEAFLDVNFDNSMNKFELFNHLNYVIKSGDTSSSPYLIANSKFNTANPSYMGIITPNVYTGNGKANADAFQDVQDVNMTTIAEAMKANVDKSIGTNYDIGLEYAYQMGYSIQQRNIDEGKDRDIVCIFMSDGAAMQYNYFSGMTSSSAWADWLQGNADGISTVTRFDYSDVYEDMKAGTELTGELAILDAIKDALFDKFKTWGLRDPDINREGAATEWFNYHSSLTADSGEYFYTYMADLGYDLDWEYLYDIVDHNIALLQDLTENTDLTATEYLGASTGEEYGALPKTDKMHPELITLLKTATTDTTDKPNCSHTDCTVHYSKLERPNVSSADEVYARYYIETTQTDGTTKKTFKYTGTSTDFFEAFKEFTGKECTFELFLQLAYKNRDEYSFTYNNVTYTAEDEAAEGEKTVVDGLREVLTALRTPDTGSTYQTQSPYYYFYNAEGKNWWAEAIKGDTDKLYPVINKYADGGVDAQGNKTYYAYNGDVENNFAGATTFVTNTDGTTTALPLSGKDYISGFKGLGMDLYTVSFSIASEKQITGEVAESVLQNIATGPSYFYAASDSDGLTDALTSIVSTMSQGATGAYFTDTMGKDYDLLTSQSECVDDTIVTPTIRVLEYTLNADGERVGDPIVLEKVTFDQSVYKFVDSAEDENADDSFTSGHELRAKSDQKYTTVVWTYHDDPETDTANDAVKNVVKKNYTNILGDDGVIRGKYFYYNTSPTNSVWLELDGDGDNNDWELAPETFFWIIGRIGQTEMVLEYDVYLTGSMEGDRTAGVYDTNEEAILRYKNYLGNDCQLDTVTPAFPWKQGRVGVAFYLVDDAGNPINDPQSKIITTFENAAKLTRPVYDALLWNSDATKPATGSITASTALPNGYTLYNPSATYTVTSYSDGHGSWNIGDAVDEDKGILQVTTYVVAGTSDAVKENKSFDVNSFAAEDTVVWFAVKASATQTVPDTVVVDYGLPVDIHVLVNDTQFQNEGELVAVGPHVSKTDGTVKFDKLVDNTYPALKTGFDETYEFNEGKATVYDVQDGVVRFEMHEDALKTGTNALKSSAKFSYAVKYMKDAASPNTTTDGIYYETVTIIPATSIYYEDSFLTYSYYEYDGTGDTSDSGNWVLVSDDKTTYDWTQDGTTVDGTQSEDRPGSQNVKIDADNIYGYDPTYANCTAAYSLGSAMKVTVGSDIGPTYKMETTAEADFKFWGTGFDVISRTDVNTGTIVVEVTDADNEIVESMLVDTYYGYTYNTTSNQWEVAETVNDAIYQVPVIKVEGLDYGCYSVKISVIYDDIFNHRDDGKYSFYLDAIRIYDPAGTIRDGSLTDEDVIDAYEKDGEHPVVYEELRNVLLVADDFKTWTDSSNASVKGAVFIDGISSVYDGFVNGSDDVAGMERKPYIGTYMSYGPNNEVYLAPGQGVAFDLAKKDGDIDPEDVEAFHIAMKKAGNLDGNAGAPTVKIFAADSSIAYANEMTISSATDLYYDFTALKGKTIIIVNTSDKFLLSITNLKLVLKSTASGTAVSDYVTMSLDSSNSALDSLVMDKAEDSFILAGANTVLGGALDMNFFIDPADLTGTDYYAEITLYAEDGTHTTTIPYADWEVRNDYLVVTQKGLAARQMADKIEVVIYNGDGTAASEVWTDSIRDYAMRILENQNDECKTLIVDMLNYGAAAQTVFGYNTDDLANNQLSETQQGYATETVSCSDQRVMGEGYYGSTLTLKDRIMLSMYFENITPDMYAMVSFTDHKGYTHETRVEGSAFAQYNSSVYGVVVDELVVADGDQLVTVTIYDADGNVVASASDTVNSYLARQMGSDAIYEMVAKFTTSAYAYFH